MKKIGVLFGMENTFPGALVERINTLTGGSMGVEGCRRSSVRNLEFPLKWDENFEYVKFPAFLKPHDGGGYGDVAGEPLRGAGAAE